MIVRDEERMLSSCLESVHGLFDELIVVDTGSSDRTMEIAHSNGARVIEVPWTDDFSAARNVSLAMATGNYAFWIDADDVVEPQERVKLKAILDELSVGDECAYVMRCASDRNMASPLIADHIRLFPLSLDIRWVYPVHEQILPSLESAGVPVRRTDITIRHRGYADARAKERKRKRDWNILRRHLLSSPNDSFVLYNLGIIVFERKRWPEALEYFRRSLVNVSNLDGTAPFRRKLFSMLAWTHQVMGNLEDSVRMCNMGLAIDPQDAELLFRKAVGYRYRGRTAEAVACWNQILTVSRRESVTSIDEGIYGHLTRRNLAIIAEERGDHAEASIQWHAVLAECPGDVDATQRLATKSGAYERKTAHS